MGRKPLHPDPKKRKPQRLTVKQAKLINARVQGKSLAEAAIAAGYSKNSAKQGAYQALKQIQGKFPDLMEQKGLTDGALIDRYLLPLMNAKTVKVFQHEGELIKDEPRPNWRAREGGLDMAFRLKGLYPSPDDFGPRGGTMVVVVDVPRPSIHLESIGPGPLPSTLTVKPNGRNGSGTSEPNDPRPPQDTGED